MTLYFPDGPRIKYLRFWSRALQLRRISSITRTVISIAPIRCHQNLLKSSQQTFYPRVIISVPVSLKLHTRVPWPTAETLPGEDDVQVPEPPTTCCMSGCANCVWVEYAEELARLYKDGGRAAEKVMKAIEDPSLKIFLSLELRDKLKSNEGDY